MISRYTLSYYFSERRLFLRRVLFRFRAVSILPNRFVGVVGEHGEFPIEQIRLSPDKNILASCSHDQKIKFWDVKHFKEMTSSEDIPSTTKSKKSAGTENFFEDL